MFRAASGGLAMLAGLNAVAMAGGGADPAVVVTVESLAPDLGTFQTPIWVGFHGGGFDSYDGGFPADFLPVPRSTAVERLAEDGDTEPISADFAALVPEGVQATVASNGPIPPLGPGQVVHRLFDVDPAVHRYFSYLSMVIPSNDAFIANGSPTAHPVFDGSGAFVGQSFVVPGGAVNDAGTEVNDEKPANTAFFGQAVPDTGVDENGVVHDHPGFLPPGSGGILDDPMFAAADFLAEGYETLGFQMRFIDAAADLDFQSFPTASQEIADPPVESEGRGQGRLQLREGGKALRVHVRFDRLSGDVTAAHLHVGPEGQNGAVVVDLGRGIDNGAGVVQANIRAEDVTGPLAGTDDPFASLLAELVGGGIYVNLHTARHPAGEIRGQVWFVSTCPADVNGDGHVDVDDLGAVTANLGCLECPEGDVDGDGEVTVDDLIEALLGFGPCNDPTGAARPAIVLRVRNRAPALGTFQTPVWVGFHDGSFDTYDGGTPAFSLPVPGSDAVERLAEDGDTAPISADFADLVPGGVQGTMTSNGDIPPLAPGRLVSRLFPVDPGMHRYFSYLSMVIPSNDAFIANGPPMAHEVFDGSGRFVGQSFVVAGTAVNDAGTEVNDELPANTAFFGQAMPDTGLDENGVIHAHPGFLPRGSGGILDDPMFANADFLAPGYEMIRVSFTFLEDVAADRDFGGDLDADQEVTEDPIESRGTGTALLLLRESGTVIEYQVTFADLSGDVLSAHLHVAPAGQNGAVVVDLSGGIDNGAGTIAGTIVAGDVVGPLGDTPDPFGSLLAELVTGGIYVNLHTAAYPGGEIRGQVMEN